MVSDIKTIFTIGTLIFVNRHKVDLLFVLNPYSLGNLLWQGMGLIARAGIRHCLCQDELLVSVLPRAGSDLEVGIGRHVTFGVRRSCLY